MKLIEFRAHRFYRAIASTPSENYLISKEYSFSKLI
jgi:hypothetical protein